MSPKKAVLKIRKNLYNTIIFKIMEMIFTNFEHNFLGDSLNTFFVFEILIAS